MANDLFKDRKISAVRIGNIQIAPGDEELPPLGAADVIIEVTTINDEPGGPQVHLSVATETNDEMTLRELQLALLGQAVSLLSRISEETPETLRIVWEQSYGEESE